jgi:hypothetical protein
MAHFRKNRQVSHDKDQEKIAMLTQAVRRFECKKIKNVVQAKNLSKKITEEWLRLTSQYSQKMNHKKFNLQVAADYEAEQQIVFCLMSSLNTKILSFFDAML